jgi:two-component system cell cycle response regulator DivK
MPQILLIEDNESNRDLVTRYLTLFDYDVAIAIDGPTGLAKAQAEYANLNLILLDMNLQGMDGWNVARQLKSNNMTKTLPIIAVTAHAMMGDREKTLAAGCDDYTTKPIDFQILLDKIHSLVCKVPAS